MVSRFAAALDELDTPHLLTRLGGDEFAVVLDEVATPRTRRWRSPRRCTPACCEPVEVGLARLHVRASIGLAMAPEHGTTRSDLLFAADAAMYGSKTSGESVSLHSPDGRRRPADPARDRRGAVHRTRQARADRRLPADLHSRRAAGRRRGPGPLGPSGAWPAQPGRLPRDGRAVPVDAGHRRAGARRDALGPRPVADPGPTADRVGERLGLGPARREHRRHRGERPDHSWAPTAGTDHRDHRDRDDARPGDGAHRHARLRRPRRRAGRRRLRHRLQLAGVPPQAAREGDQARPGVLDEPGRRATPWRSCARRST